jgi:hypothetical protein
VTFIAVFFSSSESVARDVSATRSSRPRGELIQTPYFSRINGRNVTAEIQRNGGILLIVRRRTLVTFGTTYSGHAPVSCNSTKPSSDRKKSRRRKHRICARANEPVVLPPVCILYSPGLKRGTVFIRSPRRQMHARAALSIILPQDSAQRKTKSLTWRKLGDTRPRGPQAPLHFLSQCMHLTAVNCRIRDRPPPKSAARFAQADPLQSLSATPRGTNVQGAQN